MEAFAGIEGKKERRGGDKRGGFTIFCSMSTAAASPSLFPIARGERLSLALSLSPSFSSVAAAACW